MDMLNWFRSLSEQSKQEPYDDFIIVMRDGKAVAKQMSSMMKSGALNLKEIREMELKVAFEQLDRIE